MAGLKELRTRISTVKSTSKITSAMKMVAAARLRRSQELIGKSEFYNHNLLSCANRLIFELKQQEESSAAALIWPNLMRPNPQANNYLLVVFTSDRGLCGSFNAGVAKEAAHRIEELKAQGKNVSVYCVGKKGRDILKSRYGNLIVQTKEGIAAKGAKYDEASDISHDISKAFEQKKIDICEVVVSRFKSAISREVVNEQILPLKIEDFAYNKLHQPTNLVNDAFYDYEPDRMTLLEGLLPQIFRSVVFNAIVHSQASEQGARMTSMDNATRNASDMINKLTIRYNRIRQSAITTELTEIISGAEAL